MKKINYQELDEYVEAYGFDNKTDIDDINVAMAITKIRKDRENDSI